MKKITAKEIKQITDKTEWKFAKSMPWIPHWYIVRQENPGINYEGFFNLIQEKGKRMRWGKQPIRKYLIIGRYRYWAMTEDITKSRIINREELGLHNKGVYVD